MSRQTRQALAAYAFFEDARANLNHTEDALIPLVLPAIAGRAGEIFSPQLLATALEPVFGPELVLPLAESLVEPLLRQQLISAVAQGPDGVVYEYTEKTLSIPLEESISRAEADVTEILKAFTRHLGATKPINMPSVTDSELRDRFIDWATTIETPFSAAATTGDGESGAEHDPLAMLFSGFMTSLSRTSPPLFEKLSRFAEIGLVIDLVSEIRVPSRKPRKVNLTAVLDTPILLALTGAAGPL